LYDPYVEVRELASNALRSMARLLGPVEIAQLSQRFFEILGNPPSQRRARASSTKGSDKQDESKRHGAMLGLAALVGSVPYSVPNWLPDLLVQTAAYEADPMPAVRTCVKTIFAQFTHTHQDMWVLYERLFTPEQQEVLAQASRGTATASYYM